MATPLSTFSAFTVNNRPSVVEFNRNGAVNFNGTSLPATVNQNWIPSIDNTFDLGQNSTPLRWRDLWLSRDASVGRNLNVFGTSIFAAAAQFSAGPVYIGTGGLRNYNSSAPDIGASSGRFGTGYFTALNASGTLSAGTTTIDNLTVTSIATPSRFGAAIYPGSGTVDIGASGVPWRNLYISGDIYKGGVVYNPGLSSLGDLIPSADNLYSIGSSSFRWAFGYFARTVNAGNVTTVALSVTTGNLTVAGPGIIQTTGGNDIVSSGNLVMGDFAALTSTFDGGASVGTPSFRMGSVYSINTNSDHVIPIGSGTPVSGTNVGSSTRVYQNGYFTNLQADTLVPRVNNTGSVGISSQRYGAIYAATANVDTVVSAGFPRMPAVDNMTTSFTPSDPAVYAMSASQDCIPNVSAIQELAMGDPYNYSNTSLWKTAAVQATIANETDATPVGKFGCYAHEYRYFNYGNGAIVFLRLLLQPITFAQGGSIPDTDPFFIRVQYKLPGTPVTKVKTGQWCGQAQYLQWGQFKSDGVNPTLDAYFGSWFQRQGQGGVFAAGNDGQVHIMVEPFGASKPTLRTDRFTITATFFI
jgi:hypothetical protein